MFGIGKLFSGVSKMLGPIGGLIGKSPLGGLLGGVTKMIGQAGIPGLSSAVGQFGKIAEGILGKLGGLGIGGMARPPARAAIAPFRYPRPHIHHHHHFHGTARPGGTQGGGGMSATENKLLDRFGGLEKKMNGLLDKLNKGEDLSQAELTKIQTQLTQISNAMKQVANILKMLQDNVKHIISNLRA